MSEIDDIKRRAGIAEEEQLDELFFMSSPEMDDKPVSGPQGRGREIARLMAELEEHVSENGLPVYMEARRAFARLARMLRVT